MDDPLDAAFARVRGELRTRPSIAGAVREKIERRTLPKRPRRRWLALFPAAAALVCAVLAGAFAFRQHSPTPRPVSVALEAVELTCIHSLALDRRAVLVRWSLQGSAALSGELPRLVDAASPSRSRGASYRHYLLATSQDVEGRQWSWSMLVPAVGTDVLKDPRLLRAAGLQNPGLSLGTRPRPVAPELLSVLMSQQHAPWSELPGAEALEELINAH